MYQRVRTMAIVLAVTASVSCGPTGEGVEGPSPRAEAAEPRAAPPGYRYTSNWTGGHEASWREHLGRFVGQPDVRGLEVGCFEGRSSIWFLDHVATHASSSMTCIDVFTPAIEERFDHNVGLSGHAGRVTKLKGYSQEVLHTLDYGTYDFVYIDGCHLASCVLTDAVLSWYLLKPGGVMIFDDYLSRLNTPETDRPKVAIDAFLTSFGNQLEVKTRGSQVILERKLVQDVADLIGSPVVHTPGWERRPLEEQPDAGRGDPD